MTTQGFLIELDPRGFETRLAQHAGLQRVVYNSCLSAVKANLGQRAAERTYGISGEDLTPVLGWSAPALEKYWRSVRDRVAPWYAEEGLSSRVPKEACRSLAAALSNFSKSKKGKRLGARVGFPKFRSLRKHGRKFRFDAATARPKGPRHVHLPQIGVLRTREDMGWLTDRIDAGEARVLGSAVKERAGRWWVSFQVEVAREEVNTRRRVDEEAPAAGVDVGLKSYATIAGSDGTVEHVEAPKHLVRAERKLRRLSKELARREFDRTTRTSSNRRERTRQKLARTHLNVAHARADFLHKLTTTLTTTKSVLVVEDLNIAGMRRNRRLAKAISDASWGEFLRQLEYKAAWYGSQVVKADRFFPSSKTCSGCGTVKTELTLAERTYECASCGLSMDRDVNAAVNLLHKAEAGSLVAA